MQSLKTGILDCEHRDVFFCSQEWSFIEFTLFFLQTKRATFVQQPPPYSEGTQIWLLYLYNYCTSAQSGIEHNDLHQYLRGISMQFARGVGGFHSFQ